MAIRNQKGAVAVLYVGRVEWFRVKAHAGHPENERAAIEGLG